MYRTVPVRTWSACSHRNSFDFDLCVYDGNRRRLRFYFFYFFIISLRFVAAERWKYGSKLIVCVRKRITVKYTCCLLEHWMRVRERRSEWVALDRATEYQHLCQHLICWRVRCRANSRTRSDNNQKKNCIPKKGQINASKTATSHVRA